MSPKHSSRSLGKGDLKTRCDTVGLLFKLFGPHIPKNIAEIKQLYLEEWKKFLLTVLQI